MVLVVDSSKPGLACSPKIEPSVMGVPNVSRVYDSREKKKDIPQNKSSKSLALLARSLDEESNSAKCAVSLK